MLRDLDSYYTQVPRDGFVLPSVGSGESSTTVWVPARKDRTRAALAGTGESPPAETGGDRRLVG